MSYAFGTAAWPAEAWNTYPDGTCISTAQFREYERRMDRLDAREPEPTPGTIGMKMASVSRMQLEAGMLNTAIDTLRRGEKMYGLGAVTCPPGFTATAEGCVAAAGATCPVGFVEGPPGNCAPATPGACKTIGAYYLPSQPDRCKKACPEGTQADATGICQPKTGIDWSSPTTWFAAAGAAIGLVALAVSLRRRSS